MQKRSPRTTAATTAEWCYFTVYNSSRSTFVHNSSYLFMHVSCPMVLVINPIASSSSDGDDGAGTSNDGAGSDDGNGNDRATVAMDDAGEAVAGDCSGCGGDFVGRRSRDCGRHWQQQRSPFNLERHGSMQIIFIAQVETYGQYQSKPHQLLVYPLRLPMHNGTTNNYEIEFHVFHATVIFTQENFPILEVVLYYSDFDRVLKTISEKDLAPLLLSHPKCLLPSLVLLAGFFACSCTITTAHSRY